MTELGTKITLFHGAQRELRLLWKVPREKDDLFQKVFAWEDNTGWIVQVVMVSPEDWCWSGVVADLYPEEWLGWR